MRSDVWCTNCTQRFIATLDLDLNGNHEITCPHCRHIHYRVVQDGVVTEDRWQSSAGPTFTATTSTFTNVNFYNFTVSTGTTNGYMSDLWINRTDFNV